MCKSKQGFLFFVCLFAFFVVVAVNVVTVLGEGVDMLLKWDVSVNGREFQRDVPE